MFGASSLLIWRSVIHNQNSAVISTYLCSCIAYLANNNAFAAQSVFTGSVEDDISPFARVEGSSAK
jgi:hypothetical protein